MQSNSNRVVRCKCKSYAKNKKKAKEKME